VPADGTSAAFAANEDCGTSAFFLAALGQAKRPMRIRNLQCPMPQVKHNSGVNRPRSLFEQQSCSLMVNAIVGHKIVGFGLLCCFSRSGIGSQGGGARPSDNRTSDGIGDAAERLLLKGPASIYL
jgi:hypothetical protein